MASFRLASLRDRLLLLVLLAVLPSLGLALYTNFEGRREAERDVRLDALRLARVVARAHGDLVGEARQLLIALAELPETRMPSAACVVRYGTLLREYPRYANLGVAGPDGAVVCSGAPDARPVNVADRPWFDRAVRTRTFAVGDHELSREGGPAVLVAALPILYPRGGTQAVVFAMIDATWLRRFGEAAELPPGWTVALGDERGTVLARHPDPERGVGHPMPETAIVSAVLAQRGEGTAEVTGADGVRRFVAFAPLGGLGEGRAVFATVAVPRETAFSEADRILRRNLVGLGLVALMALVAAWLGSELLVARRVKGLVTASERLAAGDLDARAEVAGADELGALARAFNAMAGRLAGIVASEQQATRTLAERVETLVAERTREAELLKQLSELLQACLTPEEAYAVIGQLIGQFFPDERGAVLVIAASRDALRPVATWGAALPDARHAFALDECWALRRGRMYRVEDTGSGLPCPHLPSPPPPATLCVPLVAQGEALGLLHLAARTPGEPHGAPRLSEARERLAVTVAEQVALALANLRLRETLRSQSIRDPLTGLFNRRYMEETLDRELRRAERGERPLSLLILDLDRFKRINDTYGHEAGDALLAALGRLLRTVCRAGDVACRYGGEEFVLILPEAALGAAQRRAEEIREAVRTLHVTHGTQDLGPVRCSIGVSAFPVHGAAGSALIRAADIALYRAKREGRDQVVVAD